MRISTFQKNNPISNLLKREADMPLFKTNVGTLPKKKDTALRFGIADAFMTTRNSHETAA